MLTDRQRSAALALGQGYSRERVASIASVADAALAFERQTLTA